MPLLESDERHLVAKEYKFDAVDQSSETHVIIHEYPLPDAYSPRCVDLLVRLPAGYPNANPDMFWTLPRVTLVNGQVPQAAGTHENHGGQTWQRWSRHWSTQWRPGVDCMETYLAAIRIELSRGI